jgi:phage terminase large subunit
MELKANKILYETDDAINKGIHTIIHRGGTGSGKTYELTMYLIFLCATLENKVLTVVSESLPHLKIGVMRYAKEILQNLGGQGYTFNASGNFYEFERGNILEFFSTDRIDKALGARRYLLYGNEINSLKYEVWEELARRSEIVIGDFNPTRKFWLEDKFLPFYQPNVVIKSNYLDNAFCPKHEKERIARRAEIDLNFRRVHIECEYGNADDLVFNPDNIILIDDFPNDLKYTYGLDFGFVAPSALVKTAVKDDNLYIHETIYRAGMNEADFARELAVISKQDKIIGDSEDSRMINYIYSHLGYNIHTAKKGAGSVDFGISYLQGKKLHITKTSINTIRELRELTHAKDRNGTPTGKYNGDDHAIDAMRYSLEDITTQRIRYLEII